MSRIASSTPCGNPINAGVKVISGASVATGSNGTGVGVVAGGGVEAEKGEVGGVTTDGVGVGDGGGGVADGGEVGGVVVAAAVMLPVVLKTGLQQVVARA